MYVMMCTGLEHGPLHSQCHVLQQKGLPHTHNTTLPKPLWDEKLLFHMHAYKSTFKAQLTVLDWGKLSSNNHVSDGEFVVADLMADVLQRDESTGLYGEEGWRLWNEGL
jgi:hypothetical protein